MEIKKKISFEGDKIQNENWRNLQLIYESIYENIDSNKRTLEILSYFKVYTMESNSQVTSQLNETKHYKRQSVIAMNPISLEMANIPELYRVDFLKKNLIEKQLMNLSRLSNAISSWLIRVNIIELRYFEMLNQTQSQIALQPVAIYLTVQIGNKTFKSSVKPLKSLIFNEVFVFFYIVYKNY